MISSAKNRLKAVSLFTGAGGLDIGFERAGFHIISALEIHPRYYETLVVNKQKKIQISRNREDSFFEGTKLINEDIRNISADELVPSSIEVDCVIGGPPCQAFSSAGKQESIFDDRGQLIYEYLRILKEIKPKSFLFENVRGIVTARGKKNEPGEILIELLRLFEEAGYNCRVSLLNSADYGSYQRRVRCIIIGSRVAAAPFFPEATHSKTKIDSTLFDSGKKQWNVLGDYLRLYGSKNPDEWVRPTQELEQQLRHIPSGSGLKSNGRAEATRPNGHWGYRQGTFIADPSLPARTVTGSSSQDWIRLEDQSLRRLTFNEVAGLQGFPSEWVFCGNKNDQFQQVGNAVPTIFGEVLGQTLANYLLFEYSTYPESNITELPPSIKNCIRYTKRDNQVNGAYRVRNKN